uniref:Uncharacterized protein n=1 Tax=Arundo donax TaxID=35708 RepID=A0A0A9AQE4_ARUDO
MDQRQRAPFMCLVSTILPINLQAIDSSREPIFMYEIHKFTHDSISGRLQSIDTNTRITRRMREGFRDAGEAVAAVRGREVLLHLRLPPQPRAERVPPCVGGDRRRRRRWGGGIHPRRRRAVARRRVAGRAA